MLVVSGTGGHIYPGISIAKELKKRDPQVEIQFVGRIKTDEFREFSFTQIDIKEWNRRILCLTTFEFVWKIMKGFIQSLLFLKRFRPDVVVGMGGYASFPVILSAYLLRIPTLVHEQNVVPGLTIKVLAWIADKIAISFEESKKYLRHSATLTGNPVRGEIGKVDRVSGLNHFGLDPHKFTILVFGGSLGAHSINKALIEALPYLEEVGCRLQIIHITGREDYSFVREKVRESKITIQVFPYILKMGHAYAASDLVICRAGATTISELTKCLLPCILIPYPYATSDHQRINAEVLEKKGAKMILDKDLSGDLLAKEILELMTDKERLNKMKAGLKDIGISSATQKLVELIYSLKRTKGRRC
ncbi:MAG: undecaprenyldiphospho-muramoylpentapeptide beta-N-acetylglucosaminyltransferase [bacterium]|nr:undecaprenyldiphospho-muramoylpentapeptide beta-N-acetylglucosaminyltransferase [bacterium]